MPRLSLLQAFSLSVVCLHLITPARASLINAPELPAAPVIDGRIADGEWAAASGSLAALVPGTGELAKLPPGRFRIAQREGMLYFLMVIDGMPLMPTTEAHTRDGAVGKDDFVEIVLQDPAGASVHMQANAGGTLWDARNGEAAWNGPWKVATSLIGTMESVGTVKRGFVLEAALPLKQAGLAAPADGETWGLWVAVKGQPHATWSRYSEGSILNNLGKLVWGGKPVVLESADGLKEGREIRFAGTSELQLQAQAVVDGSKPARAMIRPGPFDQSLEAQGPSTYQAELSNSVFSFSFAGKAKADVPVVVVPAPSRKAFYVEVDPARAHPDRGVPLQLTLLDGDRVLWKERVNLAGASRKMRFFAPYDSLAPGAPARLSVASEKPDGSPDEPFFFSLRVPEKLPWSDFELPANAPVVPNGFEPVQAGERSVSVWGRTHELGASPFLDQVTSAGEKILVSPVRLAGKVDRRDIAWTMQSWEKDSSNEHSAVFCGVATSGNLTLKVKTTVEFDGMVRFDWTLDPGATPVEISDLRLEIPVRPEVANLWWRWIYDDFSYKVPTSWLGDSGRVEPRQWRFTPFLWVGNPDRGIQWFAESKLGCTPRDPDRILELDPQPGEVTLRFRIADDARKFSSPESFTFGLMASPVRKARYATTLEGPRVVMGGSPEELLAQNHNYRWPSIMIATSPRLVGKQGSYEIYFRPEWDPNNPAEDDKRIRLIKHGNRRVPIQLVWSHEGGAQRMTVTLYKAEAGGTRGIASGPVKLEKGKWHRLTFNYGPTLEVAVDGVRSFATATNEKMPDWGWQGDCAIAPDGRMALGAWRVSDRPRSASDFRSQADLKADDSTVLLETLAQDPTGFRICNSEVGELETPSYLVNDWTYDAANRILIPGKPLPLMTYAETLAAWGAGGCQLHYWSKFGTGQGPINNPAAFKEAAGLLKKLGLRMIPYIPSGITDAEPGFEDYKWEFHNAGPDTELEHWWIEQGNKVFSGAQAGAQLKLNLWRVQNLLEAGANGVYLDSWMIPVFSTNPLLGLEREDPTTGETVPGYQIFEARNGLYQLDRLLQSFDPDGIIDAHNTGPVLPNMSLVTVGFNGEAFGYRGSDWMKYLELDRFIPEFWGQPYGFNMEGLFQINRPAPPEVTLALMAVHGTNPRAMQGMLLGRASGLWKTLDAFGLRDAQWTVYRTPGNPFDPEDEALLASTYLKPGQGALVLATNWSDAKIGGRVRIDWKSLGLDPASTPVRLLNTNELLTATDGVVTLPATPRKLLAVQIGTGGPVGTDTATGSHTP